MFSHIVIFWTKPDVENSEQQLIDGLNKYLPDIPGVISMHAGKCAPSDRPVVDQTYQVALNITFKNKVVRTSIRCTRNTWSLWKRSSNKPTMSVYDF